MANLTGSNKGRKWISKDNVSKMVRQEELHLFIDAGWVLGHVTDTQKQSKKKWYTNGVDNIIIKQGEEIPDGFKPGRICGGVGSYSKLQYKWYTNGIEQKRLSTLLGDVIPEGWYNGQSFEMAKKSRLSPKGKKRSKEQIEHLKIGAQKSWETKLKNKTFNTSKPEEELYMDLLCNYGTVYRQYKCDRYPWHCDFYIPKEDLFIELNKFPTHYKEPFDNTNPNHLLLLEHCIKQPSNWIEKQMVKVWAGCDVKKRLWAKEHNLNFIEIW